MGMGPREAGRRKEEGGRRKEEFGGDVVDHSQPMLP